MPRERSLPHAKIQIGSVHSRHFRPEYVEQIGKLGYIPRGGAVIKKRARHVGAVHGLSTPDSLPVGLLELFASLRSELVKVFQVVVEVFEGSLIDVVIDGGPVVQSPRRDRLLLILGPGLAATRPGWCIFLLDPATTSGWLLTFRAWRSRCWRDIKDLGIVVFVVILLLLDGASRASRAAGLALGCRGGVLGLRGGSRGSCARRGLCLSARACLSTLGWRLVVRLVCDCAPTLGGCTSAASPRSLPCIHRAGP